MKKRESVSDKTESKKDFLWWGLRISFWGMVGLIAMSFITAFINRFIVDIYWQVLSLLFDIIFPVIFLFSISSIIFSILNYKSSKKRTKLFPIIALVCSIIISLISCFASFMWFRGMSY